LEVFVHDRNYGYGANQKTCYREALRAGADIVVMVHPDYQYDPSLLPEIIRPIVNGQADVVLGSRLLGGNAMRDGMPWWKYIANRFLTGLEIACSIASGGVSHRLPGVSKRGARVGECRDELGQFRVRQEIVAQFVDIGMRIAEVPVPTRYFPQASSCSFVASCQYGLSVLAVLTRYVLHRGHIIPQKAVPKPAPPVLGVYCLRP